MSTLTTEQPPTALHANMPLLELSFLKSEASQFCQIDQKVYKLQHAFKNYNMLDIVQYLGFICAASYFPT